MSEQFNAWLKHELKERGWSLRELGRRSDISASAISAVLSGQREPSWEFCATIAGPLDFDIEDVFRRAGLLPPLPEAEGEDYSFKELLSIAKRLNPAQREDVLAYAMWRYQQQQKQEEAG